MIFLYADLYFLYGCWFEVKKRVNKSFITIWTSLWTNKAMNQQMNSSGLFSDSLRWSWLIWINICAVQERTIYMYFFNVYIWSF